MSTKLAAIRARIDQGEVTEIDVEEILQDMRALELHEYRVATWDLVWRLFEEIPDWED